MDTYIPWNIFSAEGGGAAIVTDPRPDVPQSPNVNPAAPDMGFGESAENDSLQRDGGASSTFHHFGPADTAADLSMPFAWGDLNMC